MSADVEAVLEGGPARRHRALLRAGGGGRGAAGGRRSLAAVVGSRWTTAVLVSLFAVQSAVIAVLYRRSIYDETYHLQAIEYFSHRWTPFGGQPEGVVGVGDLERYGSYLYHYLMSFPWRWSAGLAEDHRLILLRLLTTAIVAGALVAAHGLARDLGLGPVAANVTLLLLVVTPLLVFVGGTVSYDNLLLLLIVLTMRAAVRLMGADHVDPGGWLAFLTWAGLACVTKYVALPVVAALGVAVLVRQVAVRGRQRPSPGWRAVALPRRVLAVAGAVVAVGFVVERYVVNLVRFHGLQPDCAAVHTVASCSTYAPWQRNITLDAGFADLPVSLSGAFDYLAHSWVPLMLRYTTLYGVVDREGTALTSLGPHIGGVVVVVLMIAVLVLLVLGAGWILRDLRAVVLLGAVAVYLASLFLENYSAYRELGEPLGIQGRYVLLLLPVLLPLAVGTAHRVLSSQGVTGRRVGWAALVVLLVAATQGGGITGPVAGSDHEWIRDTRGSAVYDLLHDLTTRIVIPDDLVPDPRRPGT